MIEGHVIEMGYVSEAYYNLAAILWTPVSTFSAVRLEITLLDSHVIKVVFSVYF